MLPSLGPAAPRPPEFTRTKFARDGAEVTGAREPLTQALQLFTPGMTADYEFTPRPGEALTLRLVSRNGGIRSPVRETLSIPIVVTRPR